MLLGLIPPDCARLRSGEGGARVLRATPDWGEAALSGEHLWAPTSVSGDCCYVGDAECQVRETPYVGRRIA
ncbi:unnamed protein product [Plutella xylostella]|uniref:(diamondback moth) hypothetical protein n=1 Tax=Plutella xylostella TaxID=51655 RepID=A0A8S4D8P6_PLUXY|nr:unnamed protein product [Plutella xylostella]